MEWEKKRYTVAVKGHSHGCNMGDTLPETETLALCSSDVVHLMMVQSKHKLTLQRPPTSSRPIICWGIWSSFACQPEFSTLDDETWAYQKFESSLTFFHSLMSSGISSMACLLFSILLHTMLAYCLPCCLSRIQGGDPTTYFATNVLSCLWPLTCCPTPVPLTRNPSSTLFRNLSSVPLTENGNSSSTWCSRASLTSSACRRSEYLGSWNFPVTGCFWDWKGFGDSSW